MSTSEVLGSQCEPPSHPELLDWLATEFVRTGWEVKALHRLLVTSATYRQSSKAEAALWERDTCTLITTGPNAQVRGIHDRMPLMLTKNEYREWLAGENHLLEIIPQVPMVVHPVAMAVNQAANDTPRLIGEWGLTDLEPARHADRLSRREARAR